MGVFGFCRWEFLVFADANFILLKFVINQSLIPYWVYSETSYHARILTGSQTY